MTHYPFKQPDADYAQLYEQEKQRILSAFNYDLAIEHFGSTAVKGLGGKGSIDIYIIVPRENMREISAVLQSRLDYKFRDEAGVPNERLFHQKSCANGETAYHVHVGYFGSEDVKKTLMFRDYLKCHPRMVKKYEKVKKIASEIASQYENKEDAKHAYMNVKDSFIKKIIKDLDEG